MSGVDEIFTVTYQSPAGWKARNTTSLPGTELPVDVVSQPLTIGIFNTTEGFHPDSGRPWGWTAYSLVIGGRENPEDLTPDEREYVARMLEYAAAEMRSGSAFGPDSLRAAEKK